MRINEEFQKNIFNNPSILDNFSWNLDDDINEIEIKTGYNIIDQKKKVVEFFEYKDKLKIEEKYGNIYQKMLNMKAIYKPIDDEEKNKIVIPKNTKNNIRYLTLPTHRFCKNYEVIILGDGEHTAFDILNIIYEFYNNKELSLIDLKRLDEDDVWDYVKDATDLKKENPEEKIYYTHIMGDKMFFEGVYYCEDKSKDIQYYLSLGS
jgi:hypothetical protein